MFVETSSLRRVQTLTLLAVFALTLAGLTGCGEEEVVDPYVYTTLARVMDGDTLSTDFLFEIDAPQMDYAKGDVAMVRQGNRIEFMVAPDIENNYASYAGARLGVQKRFDFGAPYTPHLFLKRINNAGVHTMVDSLESYLLPRLFTVTQQQLETPGAPLPDLDWQRVSRIKEFYPENEGDALIEVQTMVSTFERLPRHDLTEEQMANITEADYAWYIIFEKSAFRVVDLDPGAVYMLELLKAKNLPLIGSFSIASVNDSRTDRRKNREGIGHLCGDMRINWFKYANTYVHGSQ
jgi:hypothetical protein